LTQKSHASSAGKPKSIHDSSKQKEKDLDNLLPELIAAQRASKEVQTGKSTSKKRIIRGSRTMG